MLSILDNVPCALEKKVYFAFGWNVLKISMRSTSPTVAFKTCVSLLILCFANLSTGVECGVKVFYCYCVTVNFSFYVFTVCLMYWSALRCIDIYNCCVFLLDWSVGHHIVSFLISFNLLYFKVYFVRYEDWYSSFLLLPTCKEYIFPSSHFQSICLLLIFFLSV